MNPAAFRTVGEPGFASPPGPHQSVTRDLDNLNVDAVHQPYRSPRGSQHAADAALDLGARQRHLAQPDVVERLDALAPGVDLGPVDITRRGRVREDWRRWRLEPGSVSPEPR